MTLKSTSGLLLKRSMGTAAAEDYVAWAVERLCEDLDTPSLRILAGLHPRLERHDIEPYFLKTCRELGLEVVSQSVPPRETGRLVQRVFRAGEISAEEALQMMCSLYRRAEYSDPLLSIWFDIEEELSLRGSGHEGCFYSPEFLDPLEEAVRRELVLFSRALAIDLPPGFDRFIRCDRCAFIDAPKWEHRTATDSFRSKMPWVHPKPSLWATCSRCGSFEYHSIRDPNVRMEYFSQLEKEQANKPPRSEHDGPE